MSLLKPSKIFNRITDIPVSFFTEKGIKGIILDADNTLSEHHSQIPLDGVYEWLDGMRAAGIRLMMVSNAKNERVRPFAEKLGLDFTCMACKPLPFGLSRARRKMKLKRGQTAAVGDQLFTDMMGAHLSGITPVLVMPVKCEDGWSFHLRRRLERPLIKKYREVM